MSDTSESPSSLPIRAALCVDGDAFARLGRVLRHLVVGLVDQAVNVRLVSSDPQLESLALGPVQGVIHKRLRWPATGRRIHELLDRLAPKPPTLVHAMSAESYRVAGAIAEAFDADMILQVTSMADCDAVGHLAMPRVGGYCAFSQPLVDALEQQLKIDREKIHLIRPGVLASRRIACFAEADRTPALLCTSAFEKGGGMECLIEAMSMLRSRDHTLMVFLLGAGQHESTLRRMVGQRGLSACVTFAHPMGDLTEAMAGADIFVRPSSGSAFDVGPLHAMGAGMAVVTFPSPVCDYFRDGETAIICPKPDAASLTDAIEALLNDRAYAQRLATDAREHVRAHHAMSGMADRTAAAYRKLALARATFSIRE